MSMSEWGTFWTASGVIVAIVAGLFGAWKILQELRNLREQSEQESSLKRTEFFLAQHRRLFDDKELYEVLCYLDGDDEWLLNLEMWDKKRKFLTFIEEIALLINSHKIDPDVAYYMFGHYARSANKGDNFNTGIDTSDCHWWLFKKFCRDSEEYAKRTYGKQVMLKL